MVDLSALDKYSAAYLYSRVDIPFARAITPSERDIVLDAVSQVLTNPEYLLPGRSLRATVELSPDRKANSRVMGRDFGVFRQLGAENSMMTASYNPLSIKCIRSGRPVIVATLEGATWKVLTTGREQLLPSKTDEEVRLALAESS